jgi:hypothetical protein
MLDAMRAAAAGAGPASAQLMAALEARLEAMMGIAADGAHACDLLQCSSPAVKSAQAAFHVQELSLVVEIVRRGTTAGELDAEDVDETAKTVLRAYLSFTVPWLRGRDPDEARAALQGMHSLVLSGLVRRSMRTSRARSTREA